MKLFSQDKIIVFDTEYTTWEGALERKWSGPNEYREIVQIGAVKINTANLSSIDIFSVFIKPVKNPLLSDYFTSLTGITQKDVDIGGLSFAEAHEKFYRWSDGLDLYSFGTDGEVLAENCKLFNITPLFEQRRFYVIKEIFKAHGIPADNYMSSTIIEAFGHKKTREGHNALNDALTIVDGLKLLTQKLAHKN